MGIFIGQQLRERIEWLIKEAIDADKANHLWNLGAAAEQVEAGLIECDEDAMKSAEFEKSKPSKKNRWVDLATRAYNEGYNKASFDNNSFDREDWNCLTLDEFIQANNL